MIIWGCGMGTGAARWFLVEEEEIRALVDGRKTQKRQVIRSKVCPSGKPDDLPWVKESCWQDQRDTRVAVYEETPDDYRKGSTLNVGLMCRDRAECGEVLDSLLVTSTQHS
jgi:hypothetical protein